MCYSLLLRLLRSIDAEWDPTVVRGGLVGRSPSSSLTREMNGSSKKPVGVLLSSNFLPFCPGAAAVRQLQALHGALPVPDEEHAAGLPVRQRRRHYTLRAHAEVKPRRRRTFQSSVIAS